MSLILLERMEETAGVPVLPVTLAEVKAHLHIEDDDQDVLLETYMEAATARLDGRDGLIGKALITQSWAMKLDGFPPKCIMLPLPPLQSVDEITYLDPYGDEQTLQSVITTGIGDGNPAKIYPAQGQSWPITADLPECVTVTFTAGFGSEPEDVPAALRHAILMDVAHLYENREAVILNGAAQVLPQGYMSLISAHRLWSF